MVWFRTSHVSKMGVCKLCIYTQALCLCYFKTENMNSPNYIVSIIVHCYNIAIISKADTLS